MKPFHYLRLFHWLFAGSFICAYLTGDEGELLHVWLGYGLIALLLSRLVIAVLRVRGFPALWPIWTGNNTFTVSASRMLVVALLLSTSITVVTGLSMVDNTRILGIAAGSLISPAAADTDREMETHETSSSTDYESAEWLEELHEFAANTTLGIAGAHIVFLLLLRRRFALNMIPGFGNSRAKPRSTRATGTASLPG